MYRKNKTGAESVRYPYDVPSGYDGSRFRRNGDEVEGIEDREYTLSVNGIPTNNGVNRVRMYKMNNTAGKKDNTHTPKIILSDNESLKQNNAEIPNEIAKNMSKDKESEMNCQSKPEKESLPLSSLLENGDLLLILLIFLLSGEKGNDEIVALLILLLAIR